jgi:hypothetical protein
MAKAYVSVLILAVTPARPQTYRHFHIQAVLLPTLPATKARQASLGHAHHQTTGNKSTPWASLGHGTTTRRVPHAEVAVVDHPTPFTVTSSSAEPSVHSIGVVWSLYEMWTSAPWPDMNLAAAWHLNAGRMPVPPVPQEGLERDREIHHRRGLLPSICGRTLPMP